MKCKGKKRRFDGSLNEHWTWKGTKMGQKHKYTSKEEALNVIIEQKLDTKGYKPYQCTVCGAWHIGHRH